MTDRSPQLSSARNDVPLTGDEPILKGVHSTIVVDRRSAYLAGNMKVLLEKMTDEQRTALKYWNVRTALRQAERVLPLARLTPRDSAHPNRMIGAIRRWLANPSDETLDEIRAARLNPGLIDYPALAAESAGNAATAPQMMFALIASASAARSAGHAYYGSDQRANLCSRAMRRAQLRAAYVILQRGECL